MHSRALTALPGGWMSQHWRAYLVMTSVVITCGAWTRGLGAQTADVTDRAFLEAAVVVMGYDLFAARCNAGAAFTAAESSQIDTWRRENGVDLVRERIRQLETVPDTRQKFEQTRAAFASQFPGVTDRKACAATLSLIAQPDAQLAQKSPALLSMLRAAGGSAPVARGTTPVTPPQVEPVLRVPAAPTVGAPTVAAPGSGDTGSALARRIESFGFDTRAEMGVGGFIGLAVYPVVLFRDGVALTDVEGLGFPGGVDAHRSANPNKWTRWRKQGAEIQLLKKGEWAKLAFNRTYSTLPADFRLNGRFRRLSGVGNVAIGGTSAVTSVSDYLFAPDGRVVRDGAVGSSSTAGDISVVTSTVAPNRRGRYSIDGITLRIRFDDGTEERRILVTDPADPKSVIWLDGSGYVRR